MTAVTPLPTRTETDSFGPIEVPGRRAVGRADRAQPALLRHRRAAHAAGDHPRAGRDQARRGRGEPRARPAGRTRGPQAIAAAAARVAAGEFDAQFPLSVWQTGSGTQSNMNVNEVVAHLASLALGGGLGARAPRAPERRRQPGPVVERRLPHGDARGRGAGRRGRCWRRWAGCARRCGAKADGVRATSSRSAAPTCRTPRRSRWARSSAATRRSWRWPRRRCATRCRRCMRWPSAARRWAPA